MKNKLWLMMIAVMTMILLGCPGITSETNDANGTNSTDTGTNNSGSNGGGSSNSGNNGDSWGITNVVNEFVWYDIDKSSYVGSVTYAATTATAQAEFGIIQEIRLYILDANGKERAYITMKTDKDANANTVTGTVPAGTLATLISDNQNNENDQYNGDDYNNGDYSDYGDDWENGQYFSTTVSRGNGGMRIYDIPGITVEARLIFNDGKTAIRKFKDQKGLVGKCENDAKYSLKDGTNYDMQFITSKTDNNTTRYSFNWMTFYNATGIIPGKVSLTTAGVKSADTPIDWTKEDVLNNYFNPSYNQLSGSVEIGRFSRTGEEVYDDEKGENITKYKLSGDKTVELNADKEEEIWITVVSTRLKSYKFKHYQLNGNIMYDSGSYSWQYRD